jgi:DUF1009 family protein
MRIEHVRINLQRVVRLVDSFVQKKQVHRLILAGTSEVTAELRDLLPKRLNLRVIGSVDNLHGSPLEKVLAATLPIAEAYERDTEMQSVNEVITACGKAPMCSRWSGARVEGREFRTRLAAHLR